MVCCGRREDVAVTGHDAADGHREQVRHVDLGLVAEIGVPAWEFPPEVGVREYAPTPRGEHTAMRDYSARFAGVAGDPLVWCLQRLVVRNYLEPKAARVVCEGIDLSQTGLVGNE